MRQFSRYCKTEKCHYLGKQSTALLCIDRQCARLLG